MPDDREPPPLRPPVSPWLLGALSLGWLFLLAVTLKQVGLVLTAWVATIGLVILISTRRRATPKRSPTALTPAPPAAAAPPTPATPAPAPVSGPSQTPIATVPAPVASTPPYTGGFPMVLTPENAANLLQVQSDDVVTAIRQQQIPGNRIGAHYRLRADSLLRWLDGPYRPQDHPPDEGQPNP
jgi:excisionase family DNA binding protein